MELSNKKLKFIKRNAGSMTPKDIARALDLSEKEVVKALRSLEIAVASGGQSPTDNRMAYLSLAFGVFMALTPFIIGTDIYDFANLPQGAWIQCGLILFLGVMAALGLSSGKFFLRLTPFFWPFLLFVSWALISVSWSPNKFDAIQTWYAWAASGAALVLTASVLKDNERHPYLFLVFFFVSGVLVCLLGVLQYLRIADVFFGLDRVPQVVIPAATFANKNMAAHYAVLTIPLGFGIFLRDRRPVVFWPVAVALAFMNVFLIYTKTRAAWIAVFIEAVFLACYLLPPLVTRIMANGVKGSVNPMKAVAAVASFLVFAVMINVSQYGFDWQMDDISHRVGITVGEALKKFGTEKAPEPAAPAVTADPLAAASGAAPAPTATPMRSNLDPSQELRWAIYKNTIPMILDHFWFGVGLANHKIVYPLYIRKSSVDKIFSEDQQLNNVHNDFLQAFAELGIVGVIFLLWFGFAVVGVFRRLMKATQVTHDDRVMILSAFAALIGICVNAQFCFPFQRAVPVFVFMAYLGILSAWLERLPHEEAEAAPAQKFGKAAAFFGRLTSPRTISLSREAAIAACVVLFPAFIFWSWQNARWIKADEAYLKVTGAEQAGDWEGLLHWADVALKYHPQRVRIYSYKGRAYIETSRFEEGIESLKRVIAENPNHMNALLNIGVAYGSLGRYNEALEVYNRVLAIKPDYDKAYNNIGNVLMRQGKHAEALKSFQLAAVYNPDSPLIHFNVAKMAEQTNNFRLARASLEKALALKPDWAVAHKELGLILAKYLNEPQKGAWHIQKAIQLDPNMVPQNAARGIPGAMAAPIRPSGPPAPSQFPQGAPQPIR
ncbi:MAG: tetratricopeptide repeat protein [Deltaproteobacteria bacterium]|nr:tetratricopeptide repeat protein [Deltaproteobacteria bacterium]